MFIVGKQNRSMPPTKPTEKRDMGDSPINLQARYEQKQQSEESATYRRTVMEMSDKKNEIMSQG
jgi:hypothetical protein